MLSLLSEYQDIFGPFRLFEYVTFRAGGAAFTAMFIGFFFGPYAVRKLKEFNTMAPARLEGIFTEEMIDRNKDKTPSMGGILIVISIAISTLLWGDISNPSVWVFLMTLLALSAVGFVDDYMKMTRPKKGGITGRFKLLCQFIIAVLAVGSFFVLPGMGDYMHHIMIPFSKTPLEVGAVAVFVLGVFVVIGSSNAVNLTDGKDGLAIGSTIFCALTYAGFAYISGHKIFAEHLSTPLIPAANEAVVFAAAMVGAGIGFLWHNCHPASMFMGDTGSLALGGTIGLIAVLVRQELLLPIVGGVFVMEAGSVIIQVISFKTTGKRVFRCTPIHHHFELKGWTETQIVVRFWILSGVFALIGLATLKLR